MKEIYVTYKQAQALKRIGFVWECKAHYNSDGTQLWIQHQEVINSEEFESPVAPTLHVAAKWLREVHGIYIHIEPVAGNRWTYELIDIRYYGDDVYGRIPEIDSYPVLNTYYAALSKGITEALNVL